MKRASVTRRWLVRVSRLEAKVYKMFFVISLGLILGCGGTGTCLVDGTVDSQCLVNVDSSSCSARTVKTEFVQKTGIEGAKYCESLGFDIQDPFFPGPGIKNEQHLEDGEIVVFTGPTDLL